MAIDYKKEGKIAIFTLNRPDALNCINRADSQALADALLDFKNDPDLWVGIITGAGDRAFCVGADIKAGIASMEEGVTDDGFVFSKDPMRQLLDLWKPLVAAINGMCLGGGLEIALFCDMRIAADNARFGSPEVNLGAMVGWGGSQRLPRMVPWCKAAEVLLMGRPIDAQEAYRIGLVNKVVPQDKVMATAREWAEALSQVGPLGVRLTKEAMVRGYHLALKEGLELEFSQQLKLLSMEDFKEGVAAFIEKRKPVFKAK